MEERTYLKWYNKIGYGSGDIAGNVVYALLSAFVMIFLTDTVGMNADSNKNGQGKAVDVLWIFRLCNLFGCYILHSCEYKRNFTVCMVLHSLHNVERRILHSQ